MAMTSTEIHRPDSSSSSELQGSEGYLRTYNSWYAAAAKYLQDNGSACKLTGLGLPSEMLEYTGADDEHSCPYFYLWDMQGLGKLSALTTIALINDEITGAVDETFTAGDLGDYTVTEADDGGTEVVLGAPLKFDTSNIEEMAKLY